MRKWIRNLFHGKRDYFWNVERPWLFREIDRLLTAQKAMAAEYVALEARFEEMRDIASQSGDTIDLVEVECKRLRELVVARGLKIAEAYEQNKRQRRSLDAINLEAHALQKEVEGLKGDVKAAESMYDHLYDEVYGRAGRNEIFAKLVRLYENFVGDTNCCLCLGAVIPGEDWAYEILIGRTGLPSIGDKLSERIKLIEGLLGIIGGAVCGHEAGSALFDLVFTVDQRIVIKRAKQLLEDVKACENRSTTATTTNGSGSTGAKASAGSASTS